MAGNAFAALALDDSSDEATTPTTSAPAPVPAPTPSKDDGGEDHPSSGWLPAGRAPPAPAPITPTLLSKPLIWLDLEMTGLDYGPGGDSILELSLLATDGELGNETPGPTLAIHHPPAVLGRMNEWSARTHARTGLTARCAASAVTHDEAEEQAVEFVCRVMGWAGGGPPPGAAEAAAAAGEGEGEEAPALPVLSQGGTPKRPRLATLAGSSVHVDLAFLRARMPRLASCFSHRVLDVSAVGEAVARWHPAAYHARPGLAPDAPGAHTADADVRASLAILKWYRATVFQRDAREVRRAVVRARNGGGKK
jgi:oligoribonuclease